MNETQKTTIGMPLAIVLAGALIAAAVYFKAPASKNQTARTIDSQTVQIEPITESDRLLGSKNADLTFIEYSDLECPFCKVFHITMESIIDTYGKTGKVAWAYRHFPLYKPNANGQILHSKAGKEAEAAECAFELGGNDIFWKFINRIYQVTPSNNKLESTELTRTATQLGLDVAKFNSCLTSGKYANKIDQDYQKALKAGGTGTPYVVVITKKKLSESDKQDVVARVTLELEKLNPGASIPQDIVTFDDSGNKIMWSGALPKSVIEGVIDSLI